MKTSTKFSIVAAGVLLLPALSLAATPAVADPTSVTIVQTALKAATDGIFKDLQTTGIKLLGELLALQFVLTHLHLINKGVEIDGVIAKTLGSVLWAGFCVYVFQHGAPFMQGTVNYFLDKAGLLAGGHFTPGYPLNFGLALSNNLLLGLDNSQSILSSLNPFPAIMLGLVSVAILAISGVIAFKLFMLIAETQVVIALSPLSFAFLGLDALRDQGLAPFKYLVSMAYRAIILGAVIGAMATLGKSIDDVFANLPNLTNTSVWTPIFASVLGYGILGFFALRADSIAAMLSSGTSQMSTGDAASVGAVAGAAAAAAVTGGASALGGAKAMAEAGITPMSDFMKKLGGSESSITQSGPRGDGGAKSADMLAAGAPVGGGSAPVASLADLKAMAPKEGVAQGDSPAMGGQSGSSGVGAPGGAAASGGAGGGGSAPAFSKADGRTAAASVSGGQARKNTAAVSAAMQATGANASAAGAAEMVASNGGSATEAAAAAKAWNATPEQQAAIHEAFAGAADDVSAAANPSALSLGGSASPASSVSAGTNAKATASKPGDPGWLESGSATSPVGAPTGSDARKAEGDDMSKAGIGGTNQSSTNQNNPSFMDRLEKLNDHIAREQAQVHVQINTHSD